jgi:hypothetical protein
MLSRAIFDRMNFIAQFELRALIEELLAGRQVRLVALWTRPDASMGLPASPRRRATVRQSILEQGREEPDASAAFSGGQASGFVLFWGRSARRWALPAACATRGDLC